MLYYHCQIKHSVATIQNLTKYYIKYIDTTVHKKTINSQANAYLNSNIATLKLLNLVKIAHYMMRS